MQMTRRLMVFVLVLFAVIAPIALVSVGLIRARSLIHAQAMRENTVFKGSAGGHMSQHNHGNCDEDMSTRMNVTQHMPGNMFDECEDLHDRMNMTGHIAGMH